MAVTVGRTSCTRFRENALVSVAVRDDLVCQCPLMREVAGVL